MKSFTINGVKVKASGELKMAYNVVLLTLAKLLLNSGVAD